MVGLSKSSILRRMKVGEFPHSVDLGVNTRRWVKSSVEEWMKSKVKEPVGATSCLDDLVREICTKSVVVGKREIRDDERNLILDALRQEGIFGPAPIQPPPNLQKRRS